MREGWPSMTALGVALLRGIASAPSAPFRGVDDPIAPTLLPFPASLLPALARAPLAQPIARLLSLGLLDHVALRTAAIDAELRAALARADQVVLLGAGLDARAYRMPELAGAIVLEVDVATTQALKRARLAGLRPRAREVRFVTVDFARGELDARLEDAGHDRARPTIWIWEGVMPYLPPTAARATLEVVAGRSAPGSTLLATYVTPEHVRVASRLLPVVMLAFRALGEPLIGALAPAAMRALLEETGFTVEHDGGSPDWGRAHLAGSRPVIEITERLVTARR